MPTHPVYPAFLRLAGFPVVIVGGGAVAASKLDGLLAADALVTIVAPTIDPRCVRDDVVLQRREFVPSDLNSARFVVAAATPEVNRAVAAAATDRRLLVNVVDDVELATAFLGGVIRRGDITVAISTGGAAPALAGLLREALDPLLPEDLDTWLDIARRDRAAARADGLDLSARRERLRAALLATATTAPATGALS